MSEKLRNLLHELSEGGDNYWKYNLDFLPYESGDEYDYVLTLSKPVDFKKDEYAREKLELTNVLRHSRDFEKFEVDTGFMNEAPHTIDNSRDIGKHWLELKVKE